mgnify:FL=1
MQFDLFTFLASLFNFLVLLALLRIFLFKRVTRAMDAREERIHDNWDEAQREKEDAQELRKEYEQRMEEAQEERDELLESARDQVEREKRQGLERAREDVDQQRAAWFEGLQAEKERLFRSIRSEVARATVESTEAALRALSGGTLERQIVSTLIEQLSSRRETLVEHIQDGAVRVTTSNELSDEQAERLRSAITEIATPASFELTESDEVICGVRLQLGDRELGWSVADHLESLEVDIQELVEAR